MLSASLGATALYLVVWKGAGDVFKGHFNALEGRGEKIIQRLRKNEIRVLLSLRLIPAVPFFVANLLAALSGVSFCNFVFTTVFGIFPGAVVFTSIGVGLGDVFDKATKPNLSILLSPSILLPLLGLAAFLVFPVFLKKTKLISSSKKDQNEAT